MCTDRGLTRECSSGTSHLATEWAGDWGSGAAEVTQAAVDILLASLGQADFCYFPMNTPEVECGPKEVEFSWACFKNSLDDPLICWALKSPFPAATDT